MIEKSSYRPSTHLKGTGDLTGKGWSEMAWAVRRVEVAATVDTLKEITYQQCEAHN